MLDRGGFGREAPAVGRAGDRLALGKERGEIVVARLDPVGAEVERRARQHRVMLVVAQQRIEKVDQRLCGEPGFGARLVRRDRCGAVTDHDGRSEEHTSELQSLMRISYAVFCLKKKNITLYHKSNSTSQAKNTHNNALVN